VTLDEVLAATSWDLKVASNLEITPAPTSEELSMLRELERRTARAHDLKAT
jgi:glutaconate CoA-transferase subunit B